MTNWEMAYDAKTGPFGFCHFAARPGELLALDSFYSGNLKDLRRCLPMTPSRQPARD
jgi:hypothetical protein